MARNLHSSARLNGMENYFDEQLLQEGNVQSVRKDIAMIKKRSRFVELSIFIALVLHFVPMVGRDAHAQALELLRTDVRAEKLVIMQRNFILPREEAEVFWPIYREYELELSHIWDARLKLIEEYIRNESNMTDEKAAELVERALDLDDRMTKLRRRYFRKFKRAVSATVAARFFQLDRRINSLVEIQLIERIPLI